MLSEFLADSYEKENHDEIIINPQLTKIIFDTNCFINSLNSIKNIFENTNLNIIIPLAGISYIYIKRSKYFFIFSFIYKIIIIIIMLYITISI